MQGISPLFRRSINLHPTSPLPSLSPRSKLSTCVSLMMQSDTFTGGTARDTGGSVRRTGTNGPLKIDNARRPGGTTSSSQPAGPARSGNAPNSHMSSGRAGARRAGNSSGIMGADDGNGGNQRRAAPQPRAQPAVLAENAFPALVSGARSIRSSSTGVPLSNPPSRHVTLIKLSSRYKCLFVEALSR